MNTDKLKEIHKMLFQPEYAVLYPETDIENDWELSRRVAKYLTTQKAELLNQVEEKLPKERKLDNVSGKDYHNGFNACLRDTRQALNELRDSK